VTLLNIHSWEAPPPLIAIERVRPDVDPHRKPRRWDPGISLRPADIYCYLKARFGKPNGSLMFSVPPSSDNLIHWHYTLVSGEDTLHIQEIGARVELTASSTPPLCDDDWRQLVTHLKDDFSRLGPQMKAVREGLERWTIFVNPYFRLEGIVADLHARLDSLHLERDYYPDHPIRQDELVDFEKSITRLYRKYTKAVELGLALRLISPVWGESFVNLVIFLFAKPDVKSNSRLYQDLIRKEIDVRLAALHLHCDGFRTPIDPTSGPVKDFLAVMNSRNDFLHGNVDPMRLAVDEIFFEGKMPLFMRYQTLTQRALEPRLKFIEPELAKQDIYRIEAFIAYVLEQLEPPTRNSLKLFMDAPLPGWRSDTGRPGILFSDTLMDLVVPEQPASDV
jgi:hypothetical protein